MCAPARPCPGPLRRAPGTLWCHNRPCRATVRHRGEAALVAAALVAAALVAAAVAAAARAASTSAAALSSAARTSASAERWRRNDDSARRTCSREGMQ